MSGAACDQTVDCGATGGVCNPFDRNVGELGSAPTDLGDYSTSIECVNQLGTCTGNPGLSCINDNVCEVLDAGACDIPLNVVGSCDDCTDIDVVIPPAQTAIVCTITNTLLSKIIVVKQTNPDGDSQSFAFTASYDADGFSLVDGGSNNSGDLDPGTYSVSENVPAGWDLTSATCSDGSSPASIGLAAGETVTCTFNNQQDARILVTKVTIPAGDATIFGFTSSFGIFTLGDGQFFDSGDLDPGVYSVGEDNSSTANLPERSPAYQAALDHRQSVGDCTSPRRTGLWWISWMVA